MAKDLPSFMKVSSLLVLFGYLIFNLYLRFFTFHYSTIDWDEVTYFLIGKGILAGKIPYVELWDLKPVGSFLLYAFFIPIFGYATETIRIVSWLFSSLLAFGIFLHLKKNFFIAFLSGFFILYLFILFPSGLSGNTELLFTPLEVISLYLILQESIYKNRIGFFLLGFAFIVKYIIVFDVFLFVLFYIFWKDGKVFQTITRQISFRTFFFSILKKAIVVFLFLLPFLSVGLFYFFTDHFQEFWEVTFGVVKSHKKEWEITEIFLFGWKLGKIFLPIGLPAIGILIWKKSRVGELWLFLGWIFTSFLGAIWTGFLYEHYLLACLPSWVLFTGRLVSLAWESVAREWDWKWKRIVFLGLFVFLIFISAERKAQLEKILSKIPDEQRELAKYLKQEKVTNLFVGYGYHTTYVLLDLFPPIKLVQPNNYTEEIFAKNFSVKSNPIFETLTQKDVRWIQWCSELSPDKITQEYAKEKGINFEYILQMDEYLQNYKLVFEFQTCKIFQKR